MSSVDRDSSGPWSHTIPSNTCRHITKRWRTSMRVEAKTLCAPNCLYGTLSRELCGGARAGVIATGKVEMGILTKIHHLSSLYHFHLNRWNPPHEYQDLRRSPIS